MHYERVNRYNHWNSIDELSNVALFLTDTALMWYEDHEDHKESLTTSALFAQGLKKCLGDSDSKNKSVEWTLAQRTQTPGETRTTYIEDVLNRCKIISPQISEEDRVGHLLKGIAEKFTTF